MLLPFRPDKQSGWDTAVDEGAVSIKEHVKQHPSIRIQELFTMIKFLSLLGLVAFVAAQSFEDYGSSEVREFYSNVRSNSFSGNDG